MTLLQELKLQYKMGSVTTRLVFFNIILFIIPEIIFAILKLFSVQINYFKYISLSSSLLDLAWKPWSIISYAFFHNDILHLIFNMLMLYFVGRLFITFFTQKQLFAVYILGGVFSGIFYLLGYQYIPSLKLIDTQMIGASGAIMAVLFAIVTFQPQMDVKIFGVFKMRIWQIGFLILFLDFIQLPLNNTGGHIAHLSGALFGYIYVRFLQNGIDIGNGFNTFIDYIITFFKPQKGVKFKKVLVNPKKPTVQKESKIVVKDKIQQQIDEILDKISKSGYDSLTKAEKDFLFQAGK